MPPRPGGVLTSPLVFEVTLGERRPVMLRDRGAVTVTIIELAVIGAVVLWFTLPRPQASTSRVVSTAPTLPPVKAATKAPTRLRAPKNRAQPTPPRPGAKPLQQRTARAPKRPKATPVQHRAAATPARAQKPEATRKKVAAPGRIRIVAAHGDSWLSVHRASQNGRLLYEGTLTKGRVLTYGEPRIWVRFGGASNMAVFVNGKPVRALVGTIDAVVDRSGIHAP
jgi:uncharacterized protein DUF4115